MSKVDIGLLAGADQAMHLGGQAGLMDGLDLSFGGRLREIRYSDA